MKLNLSKTTNEKLLKIYLQGFRDEFEDRPEPQFSNDLEKTAYQLGRTDYKIGDDIPSFDYRSNEEILKEIKSN